MKQSGLQGKRAAAGLFFASQYISGVGKEKITKVTKFTGICACTGKIGKSVIWYKR